VGRCAALSLSKGWSVDPADEFYSPYNYVGNNPINYIDPDGTCSSCGDPTHKST
jgi:hypothetical protein